MPSWKVVVLGRVQGVGFRRYVFNCARQNGITGYASNQVNGSVLIQANGEQDDFRTFCDLLRLGTRYAQVEDLEITEMKSTVEYNDFEIR